VPELPCTYALLYTLKPWKQVAFSLSVEEGKDWKYYFLHKEKCSYTAKHCKDLPLLHGSTAALQKF